MKWIERNERWLRLFKGAAFVLIKRSDLLAFPLVFDLLMKESI